MQRIPVDVAALGEVKALAVVPALDNERNQRSNLDGIAQWKVQVLITPEPREGAYPSKPTVEEVTVSAATAPVLAAPMAAVEFTDLLAMHWEMNGRSGIALRAGSVAFTRTRGE